MSNKHAVLFVDDQKDILILIERILKNEDYTKFFANGPKEALDILEKESIDVIVTDMLMPDIGGLQFLEILKLKYPSIVRVVLSGYAQVPFIVEAINRGDIFRYITKPWKVTDNGKMIIRDAIQYSDYIKRYGTYYKPISGFSFTEENIKDIMSSYKKEFFITVDDKLVLKSDTITELTINEEISEKELILYNKHKINNDSYIYIKK